MSPSLILMKQRRTSSYLGTQGYRISRLYPHGPKILKLKCLKLQAKLHVQWLEFQHSSAYPLCAISTIDEGQVTTQKVIAAIHFLATHIIPQSMKPGYYCLKLGTKLM